MINKTYLSDLKKIKQSFRENKKFPSVTLFKFLESDFYTTLKREIVRSKFKKEFNLLTHSYKTAKVPEKLRSFLYSVELRKLIYEITGHKLRHITAKLYKLSKGDYAIISDRAGEEEGPEIYLDFADFSNNYGGYTAYADGKGTVWLLPAKENAFSLVEKNSGISWFVKYINHYATSSRIFCLIKLELY